MGHKLSLSLVYCILYLHIVILLMPLPALTGPNIMNTITPNQYSMLKAIARSDYTNVNNAEPDTLEDVGTIWLLDVVKTQADKGTAVSLVNAGLIGMWAEPKTKKNALEPSDSTIWLTQAGFDAYKAYTA